MAKKTTQQQSGTAFEGARRKLDEVWMEKHGYPTPDYIVNISSNDRELRALGYFLQPDFVNIIGNELHFDDTSKGQMAKGMWQNVFYDILIEKGFKIYQKPSEGVREWENLSDTEKIAFAKGIWAKRGFETFSHEIQSVLCRIKKAPSPESLKQMLENIGININELVKS